MLLLLEQVRRTLQLQEIARRSAGDKYTTSIKSSHDDASKSPQSILNRRALQQRAEDQPLRFAREDHSIRY